MSYIKNRYTQTAQMTITMTDGKWEGRWFLITGPVHLLGENDPLEQAKTKLSDMKLKDWIVGQEAYESGEFHYHIVIQAYKNVRLSTVRKWFPKFNSRACHPKGGEDAGWNYAMKDGNYIMKEKKQGQRTDLEEMKKAVDRGEDMDWLWENYFTRMVQYHRSMAEYIKVVNKKRVREEDPDVDPKRFCVEKYTDWPKPLVLQGPPGIGKTEWAKSHFENPCLISHVEDLRDVYNPKIHDGLVFDDMVFQRDKNPWPRQSQIHLLDVKYSRSLHMRNTNWTRPAGVKMIFCGNLVDGSTNEPIEIFLNDDAIHRRVNYMERNEPFYE